MAATIPARPLTRDDLASAKSSIVEELHVIGRQAAERLRVHLRRAEQLQQSNAGAQTLSLEPAPSANGSPAPSTLTYATAGTACNMSKWIAGNSHNLQPSCSRLPPLLTCEALENLLQQHLVHDQQLPSRWEQELERRLRAHTPSTNNSPVGSTATNSPNSSCPSSPLLAGMPRGRPRRTSRLATPGATPDVAVAPAEAAAPITTITIATAAKRPALKIQAPTAASPAADLQQQRQVPGAHHLTIATSPSPAHPHHQLPSPLTPPSLLHLQLQHHGQQPHQTAPSRRPSCLGMNTSIGSHSSMHAVSIGTADGGGGGDRSCGGRLQVGRQPAQRQPQHHQQQPGYRAGSEMRTWDGEEEEREEACSGDALVQQQQEERDEQAKGLSEGAEADIYVNIALRPGSPAKAEAVGAVSSSTCKESSAAGRGRYPSAAALVAAAAAAAASLQQDLSSHSRALREFARQRGLTLSTSTSDSSNSSSLPSNSNNNSGGGSAVDGGGMRSTSSSSSSSSIFTPSFLANGGSSSSACASPDAAYFLFSPALSSSSAATTSTSYSSGTTGALGFTASPLPSPCDQPGGQ
ncbi:hypothetical protein Agub_g12363 [Astrephomene gubernaculifera]|uniref:Uncharacterized protein n=1 Tax=Astrephomene gubernaculifera TaxID=47775 RepID=A0AAD3HRR3_9CHLO|nr:hypothetical protein Agub_g12363 [Astrephomene gubernaculifera]